MAKEVKAPSKMVAASAGRVRQLTKRQARTKAKKDVKSRQSLIGSFRLTAQVFSILKANWRTLGGVVVVYLLLNIVFASGISNISASFSNIKTDLQAKGALDIWHATSGFASLVGSSGSSGSATGSALQSVLFVIESLVIIWALRHLLSGQKFSVKEAYYRSTTPLIPFLLVIAVIVIQLLPATIGALVMSVVINSVITSVGIATTASVIIFIVLAAWSIYMVSASIFAIYIVTLPDMQPRQALRSAKDLVKFRRVLVIRKVLFLPLLILVIMGVIVVPLIMFASFLVPFVFYVLSMLSILFIHTYLYSLYRSLIE